MQKVGRVRNTMSALYLAFAVFLVESGFLFPASAADYQYILNTYNMSNSFVSLLFKFFGFS